MVRINGLCHLLINGVLLGVITHFLTFLLTSWDILVVGGFNPFFEKYYSQNGSCTQNRVENTTSLKPLSI